MSEWNTEYNGISVHYEAQFVHIQTDAHLLKFLGRPGKDAVALAQHIKKAYQSQFGRALNISEESLSVEILVHAYLDVLLRGMGELSKGLSPTILKDLIACLERLEGHTKIIDCGEAEVDSNRHVFDRLVPYRHFIYGALGARA